MKFLYFTTVFLALSTVTLLAADKPVVQPVTLALATPATTPSSNEVAEAKPPGAKFTNSVSMELIKVGSFWAGKYEVTQSEYLKIMGANPSEFSGPRQPVENISWNDAVLFCQKLTAADLKKKVLPEGYFYTLPTEAEWLSLVGDASLDSAVTGLSAHDRTAPQNVGSFAMNNLGLCDIRGNVMEFCLGDDSKPFRFLKGGSWKDFVEVNLRTDFHWWCKPDEHANNFGVRVILKAGN